MFPQNPDPQHPTVTPPSIPPSPPTSIPPRPPPSIPPRPPQHPHCAPAAPPPGAGPWSGAGATHGPGTRCQRAGSRRGSATPAELTRALISPRAMLSPGGGAGVCVRAAGTHPAPRSRRRAGLEPPSATDPPSLAQACASKLRHACAHGGGSGTRLEPDEALPEVPDPRSRRGWGDAGGAGGVWGSAPPPWVTRDLTRPRVCVQGGRRAGGVRGGRGAVAARRGWAGLCPGLSPARGEAAAADL